MAQTDTLEGLSIRYNVAKDVIRRANEFSGDEIYMKRELIIPETSTISLINFYRWSNLQVCHFAKWWRSEEARSNWQIKYESPTEIQIPTEFLGRSKVLPWRSKLRLRGGSEAILGRLRVWATIRSEIQLWSEKDQKTIKENLTRKLWLLRCVCLSNNIKFKHFIYRSL